MSHCKICGLWKETPNHRMNLEPLEERIRELEAELTARTPFDNPETPTNRLLRARAEKAEARIAELERWLEDFGITREAAEHRLSKLARATNLED